MRPADGAAPRGSSEGWRQTLRSRIPSPTEGRRRRGHRRWRPQGTAPRGRSPSPRKAGPSMEHRLRPTGRSRAACLPASSGPCRTAGTGEPSSARGCMDPIGAAAASPSPESLRRTKRRPRVRRPPSTQNPRPLPRGQHLRSLAAGRSPRPPPRDRRGRAGGRRRQSLRGTPCAARECKPGAAAPARHTSRPAGAAWPQAGRPRSAAWGPARRPARRRAWTGPPGAAPPRTFPPERACAEEQRI
mmetsp:Transcript_94200/g.270064  ORF Transcript_94200/g.270064 Transcript_94200/m.270064 type:complete len:244 (+) Transcript_94200:164-895(+)